MNQTLAEANRPKLWDELLGQEWAKNTLIAEILNNQVRPGYLFEGLTGCGKTTAAFLFAKRLLCQTPNGVNPCNTCLSCTQVDRGSSQNFEQVNAADNRSLDFVRDYVISWLRLAPVGAPHRVMVIDEAHSWPRVAISPFLIELERMPKRSHVIFCTTESGSILPEIRGRVQSLLFSRLPSVSVAERVADKLQIDVPLETLTMLVDECGGSFRQVWTTLEPWYARKDSEPLTEELIHTLLNALPKRDRVRLWEDLASNNLGAAAKRWRSWISQGVNPIRLGRHLMNDLLEMVADNPMVDWSKPLAILSGVALQNNPDLWLPAIVSIGGYPYATPASPIDFGKPADIRRALFP